MSWLADLLKHLTISKIFAGAIFITSSVMLLATKFAPTQIDPIPSDWRWLVFTICIFSFALLVMWSIPPIFKFLASVPDRLRKSTWFNPLDADEKTLLVFLGNRFPNSYFDIMQLQGSITGLEALRVRDSLERRGLIVVSGSNDNQIILSTAGRQLARELFKTIKT